MSSKMSLAKKLLELIKSMGDPKMLSSFLGTAYYALKDGDVLLSKEEIEEWLKQLSEERDFFAGLGMGGIEKITEPLRAQLEELHREEHV